MPNIKDFLERIAQIESSGGKNFQHQEIQQGIHSGTSGIGRYGLMPNTVKELINRRRLQDGMTPEYQDLNAMNPDQIKQYLEMHPETEDQFANQLAQKVLTQNMGDEDKAAYSWNFGHNTPTEKITPEILDTNPYVQKFRRISNILKSNVQNE